LAVVAISAWPKARDDQRDHQPGEPHGRSLPPGRLATGRHKGLVVLWDAGIVFLGIVVVLEAVRVWRDW